MNAQVITPELKEWIINQARAGCRPQDVLNAMRASGWDEEIAITAMEDTLQQFLTDQVRTQELPPVVPVPDPDLTGSPQAVFAHDREVKVLLNLKLPRVVVFGGLLSDEECDAMIALAKPRMARSETVQNDTGGSEVNPSRTSQGMFFERGEFELCDRIERRIAALVRWPIENGEGLQVLNYQPGSEYKAHNDYFDPSQPGTPTILQRGGQRVGTVVMYLNTPVRGGGTSFPDAGLEVAAQRGNAVFFSYDRPHAVTRTLHAGTPVLEGEKWVATKWMREREFR